MPLRMIVYYFYTIIGGYSTLVQKVVAQKEKKKKKSRAKITFSICLKDKRLKRGVGVVDSWKV